MPYKLRKAPKRDAYWVINTQTKTKHSKEPLPKERAEAQMRALYAAEGETEGGAMCGGAAPKGNIPIPLLQVLARAAYSGRTPLRAGGFELVRSSPTVKIYKRGDLIVVSVRGTDPRDKGDIAADLASVQGTLRETQRYKGDEDFLRKFQSEYPKSKFRYTAVGHSLGGAIIDGFFRDRLIDNALSFNPMVEPHERGGNPRHRRIYNNEDPLYLLFGKHVPNVEVRDPNDPLWKMWLKYKLPHGMRELFALYDAHRLQSFRGGGPIGDAILAADPPNQTRVETKEVEVDEEVPEVVPVVKRVRDAPVNAIAFAPNFSTLPPNDVNRFIFSAAGPVKIDAKMRKAPTLLQQVKFVGRPVDIQTGEMRATGRMVKTGNKIKQMVPTTVDMNPEVAAQLKSTMDDLRTLSHFYTYRDPAIALGMRVVADEIFQALPQYGFFPKGYGDPATQKTHEDAQALTALTILGKNKEDVKLRLLGKNIAPEAELYQQTTPDERVRNEVEPFFPLTLNTADPKNPMYDVKPKARRFDVPPRTQQQMEFMLQLFPELKGPNMYMEANKSRVYY